MWGKMGQAAIEPIERDWSWQVVWGVKSVEK
jgi:hypothetical protein